MERISSPEIACLIAATAGLKRSTWPTISVTPARRAASTMSRPSSTVEATGFSTRMWMLRAMQASAISWCRWVGAAIVTASTPSAEQLIEALERAAADQLGGAHAMFRQRIDDTDQRDARADRPARGHGCCPSRRRR